MTTFVLGTYRGSGYHDCTHKAVISLIEQLVKKAKDNNVKVNVAGNVNKKLCHICEQIGVDGFIINYPLLPEFQTFLSPAGTYNGVRFWAEARLNNRTKSYSGVAKSVASQSINSIGGYYFGLREYCNGIMHGNTPYPGWTSSPGSSASASTAIIDWSPNCSDNLPIGSGIGGKFVFNFYNHEEEIIWESPVFWR